MVEEGPWFGSIHTWRCYLSQQICTISVTTSSSAVTWNQDGVIFLRRDDLSQQRCSLLHTTTNFKVVRFAYKGWFNWNIDNDWTGGILIEPKKIVDTCTRTDFTQGIEPAPSSPDGDRRLLGINFDKHSPRNYISNCVTYHGTFDSQTECRWQDCHGGSGNNALANQQMTIAIYIR